MTQYNTSKGKIRETWNRTFSTTNQLFIQKSITDQINKRFIKLDNYNQKFQVIEEIEFEWSPIVVAVSDSNGDPVNAFVSWRIEFEGLDEIFRHAIRPTITRRFGEFGSDSGELNNSTSVQENIVYQSTSDGRFIMDACVALSDVSGLQDDIQYKLLVYLINPYLYQ